MKTLSIKLVGCVYGRIWMPSIECEKEFTMCLSRTEDKPFTRRIDSLRDALLSVTNDGDFQDCKIVEAFLIVTKQKGFSQISRTRELRGIGENADCFVPIDEHFLLCRVD